LSRFSHPNRDLEKGLHAGYSRDGECIIPGDRRICE